MRARVEVVRAYFAGYCTEPATAADDVVVDCVPNIHRLLKGSMSRKLVTDWVA
jgi:hypothetical protein